LSSSGPRFPTIASGNSSSFGASIAWLNPQNIEAADGNVATCLPGVAITDDLIGQGFGFSLPSTAIIDGILLEVNAAAVVGGIESYANVLLLKNGSIAGSNRAAGTLASSLTTNSFGGSSDKWGTTWLYSDINDINFGALVNFQSSAGGPGTIQVDFYRITVFFHNVFNDSLSFSSTTSIADTPVNIMNAAISISSTSGLTIIETLTMAASLSFQNIAGFSDLTADIPGPPLLGFSITAGMSMSASNAIRTQLSMSMTAGIGGDGGISGSRGMQFGLQAGVFMNATIGGRPLLTATDYTSLVTSEHNKRPNFMAMIAQDVQGYVDTINLLRSFSTLFDIDQARGQQLDMIGVWIGISRNILIPLSGVYFAFNTTSLGFNQGTWFGIGDSTSGVTTLSDGDYLILLKAKIASNHWNGTIPGAYAIWAIVFQFQGFILLIQDGQDMTMAIIIIGTVTSAVTLSLITNGYIALRPAGVQISGYYQNTVANFPVFGFGIENSTIAGFNDGAWVAKIG